MARVTQFDRRTLLKPLPPIPVQSRRVGDRRSTVPRARAMKHFVSSSPNVVNLRFKSLLYEVTSRARDVVLRRGHRRGRDRTNRWHGRGLDFFPKAGGRKILELYGPRKWRKLEVRSSCRESPLSITRPMLGHSQKKYFVSGGSDA